MDVDVEDDIEPGLDVIADHAVRGAIIVSKDRRVFGELAGVDFGFERVDVDEIVFDAIFFATARGTRGGGA